MATFTGVFPVNELTIEVGTSKSAETWTYNTIADMETASISVETGVETWTPLENEGWQNALATAKACTVSMSGKRNIGDIGNDFIANKLLENGQNSNTSLKITFPDGSIFIMGCVVSISNFVGSDSTAVAPLEFDLISNGKPTLTPAV